MSLDLRRGESDDIEEKKEASACYSSGKFLKFEPYPTPHLKAEKVDSPSYFFKFTNNSGVSLIRNTLEFNGFKEILGIRN